jgi:hypothetical protein
MGGWCGAGAGKLAGGGPVAGLAQFEVPRGSDDFRPSPLCVLDPESSPDGS